MNKIRGETALAAALRKAGYSGGRDRVYARVAKLLSDNGMDTVIARKRLLSIVRVDEDFLIALADFVVQTIAADMANELPGVGHFAAASDGQTCDASTRQPDEDGAGHYTISIDGQPANAQSSSLQASGTGQIGRASDGQLHASRSARHVPDTPAKRAARVRTILETAERLSVFDTFKVRDGRGIGSLSWGELESMESTNAREAYVLRQLRKRAQVADHSTKVRDVISEADLQRMIQKAAELFDTVW